MNKPSQELLRVAPQSYCASDVYARELTAVFYRVWVCVGYRQELANPDDFIARRIGGLGVVVQNFSGVLRAFHNKCSHRHTVLQNAPCGNRPLVCPYHGWRYDEQGIPVGIPHNQEFFGFDAGDKASLALAPFQVETLGPFVFVKIKPGPPTLREYLGQVWDLLEPLPATFSEDFHREIVAWKTNWKIAVESVLEGYHVGTAHASSFNDIVDCGTSPITLMGRHALQSTALSAKGLSWWDGMRRRLKLRSFADPASYWHLFVFPNLAIGVAGGAMLITQTYWPVAPTETRLEYRLWLADGADAAAMKHPVRKGSYQSLTDFNRVILDEDRVVSELAQRGAQEAVKPGVFGRCEERLRHFHEAIAQLVLEDG